MRRPTLFLLYSCTYQGRTLVLGKHHSVIMSASDASTSARPRLLCYGDSLTAGYTSMTKYTGTFVPWAPQLADALGVIADHVGMCGWKAAQMLEGVDCEENEDGVSLLRHPGLRRLLEEGHYTHVLLMAGTNDLKSRTASEIAESLEKLHGVCHAIGVRTLALAMPHSKTTTFRPTGRGERRRQVHERLRGFAACSSGWCEFCAPGEAEQPWVEGSADFEVDGLHMTGRGYERFAALLLRSPVFQGFLRRRHPVDYLAPELPTVSPADLAWRRGMRRWMQRYRDAVNVVQVQRIGHQPC